MFFVEILKFRGIILSETGAEMLEAYGFSLDLQHK